MSETTTIVKEWKKFRRCTPEIRQGTGGAAEAPCRKGGGLNG